MSDPIPALQQFLSALNTKRFADNGPVQQAGHIQMRISRAQAGSQGVVSAKTGVGLGAISPAPRAHAPANQRDWIEIYDGAIDLMDRTLSAHNASVEEMKKAQRGQTDAVQLQHADAAVRGSIGQLSGALQPVLRLQTTRVREKAIRGVRELPVIAERVEEEIVVRVAPEQHRELVAWLVDVEQIWTIFNERLVFDRVTQSFSLALQRMSPHVAFMPQPASFVLPPTCELDAAEERVDGTGYGSALLKTWRTLLMSVGGLVMMILSRVFGPSVLVKSLLPIVFSAFLILTVVYSVISVPREISFSRRRKIATGVEAISRKAEQSIGARVESFSQNMSNAMTLYFNEVLQQWSLFVASQTNVSPAMSLGGMFATLSPAEEASLRADGQWRQALIQRMAALRAELGSHPSTCSADVMGDMETSPIRSQVLTGGGEQIILRKPRS